MSEALRSAVVAAGARLVAAGVASGTAGNIGVRVPHGLLVTPSAIGWDELQAGDVVAIDLDGGSLAHRPGVRPSSEWRLHAAVLRARADAGAVVHAHPPFATALACLRRPIPAFHYMVALAGGDDIPCTPWAVPGSDHLAQHAANALRDRDACLLANHGIVAIGADLDTAVDLAIEVETMARQYCIALQAGEPVLLGADEMRELVDAMGRYRRARRDG